MKVLWTMMIVGKYLPYREYLSDESWEQRLGWKLLHDYGILQNSLSRQMRNTSQMPHLRLLPSKVPSLWTATTTALCGSSWLDIFLRFKIWFFPQLFLFKARAQVKMRKPWGLWKGGMSPPTSPFKSCVCSSLDSRSVVFIDKGT